jgi:hypothetical protein
MKKHIIDKSDLKDYSFTHVVASSYGRGESKKLLAVVKNDKLYYEIHNHGDVVGPMKTLEEAIDIYNEI